MTIKHNFTNREFLVSCNRKTIKSDERKQTMDSNKKKDKPEAASKTQLSCIDAKVNETNELLTVPGTVQAMFTIVEDHVVDTMEGDTTSKGHLNQAIFGISFVR